MPGGIKNVWKHSLKLIQKVMFYVPCLSNLYIVLKMLFTLKSQSFQVDFEGQVERWVCLCYIKVG